MNLTGQLIIYWLPYIAGISIVVIGIFYIWKSVFADRNRGGRRCPRCWYDMTYSQGMTCSECGHTAQCEQDFTHTRRRWGRASFVLVLCVATILGMYWKLLDRGIIASLPTPILTMVMPLARDSGSEVFKQLSRRMMMSQVTDEQSEKIIARCVKGDWTSSPPDEAWINKYGMMLNTMRPRLVGRRNGQELHTLEKPLLNLPVKVDFDTRESWPAGASARIRVRARNWWPAGHYCRMRITNVEDPTDTRIIVQQPNRNGPSAYVLMSLPLTETQKELIYEVEVYRRRTNDDEVNQSGDDGWVRVNKETVTLPITIVDSLEAVFEPVSDEVTTKAMKSVFGSVTRWTGGPQPVRFQVLMRQTFIPEFNDTAIGVSVELFHNDRVVRQLDLWWIAGEDVTNRGYEHAVPFEDPETLLQITEEDLEANWELRVRSDPALALRAGDAPFYWKGDFTIAFTLDSRENDVRPKPRNWWVEEEEGEGDEK